MTRFETAKNFSFAEIVKDGRDPTVRLTDDLLLFTVDLVYVVTKAKTPDDASKTLRRLLARELFSSDQLSYKTFSGSGNSNTCLVSFENAIELIMVLGSANAKKNRRDFAKPIQRYLGGDTSMIIESVANAVLESPKSFLFASIVNGRDYSVRVTDDGLLAAVDIAMIMSGKSKRDAGKDLRNLNETLFSAANFTARDFTGQGNKGVRLVTPKAAIELIMVLPGKVAKETRIKFADIIHRYIGGDTSMITEIVANAASESPIAQLARATLPVVVAPTNDAAFSIVRKRKVEELEIATMEMDLQERAERVKAMSIANYAAEQTVRAAELANRTAEMNYFTSVATSYKGLCEDNAMDERARLMFKDNYINVCMAKSNAGLLITNGAPKNTPISLSMVAVELGLKLSTGELISAGSELSKCYFALHNKPPTKHGQLCGGRMTPVNSYMESDRALMEEVLRRRHPATRV